MSALSVAIDDGVAVVTFDLPGEPVNKFSKAVIAEFVRAQLAEAEQASCG